MLDFFFFCWDERERKIAQLTSTPEGSHQFSFPARCCSIEAFLLWKESCLLAGHLLLTKDSNTFLSILFTFLFLKRLMFLWAFSLLFHPYEAKVWICNVHSFSLHQSCEHPVCLFCLLVLFVTYCDHPTKSIISCSTFLVSILLSLWPVVIIQPSLLYSKTSFKKNCFSAWASTLNMGLINKVDMLCLSPVGYGV